MWIIVLTLAALCSPEASSAMVDINHLHRLYSRKWENKSASEVEAVCNQTLAYYGLQWDDAPFSCKGRCGSERETPCSCDALCAFYGQCCGDFELQCPEIETYQPTFHTNNDGNSTGVVPRGQDGYIPFAECARCNSRLISSCPNMFTGSSPEAALLDSKCRIDETSPGAGVQDMLPVTDQSTGLHYKNVHCLLCNRGKATDGLAWTLEFKPSVRYRGQLQTLQDALTIAKMNTTNVFASSPEGIRQRFCISDTTWTGISAPCECDNLKVLCERKDEIFVWARMVFRNKYCLLCFLAMLDPSDMRNSNIRVPTADEIRHYLKSFSFSIVLRWSAGATEKDSLSSGGVKDLMSSDVLAGSVSLLVDNSFAWRRMECRDTRSLNTSRLDGQLDVVTKEASDSKFRTDFNALSDLGAETEGDKNETTGSTDQELRGNEEGEKAADTDPVSCTQHDCRPRTFPLQGQCMTKVFLCQATASFLGSKHLHAKLSPGSHRRAVEDKLEDDLKQALDGVHSDFYVVNVSAQYVALPDSDLNVTVYTKMTEGGNWYGRLRNVSAKACRRVYDIVNATLVQEVEDERFFSLCVRRMVHKAQYEPCLDIADDEGETTEPAPASRAVWLTTGHSAPALVLSLLLALALVAR